jgi:hypothetical protein
VVKERSDVEERREERGGRGGSGDRGDRDDREESGGRDGSGGRDDDVEVVGVDGVVEAGRIRRRVSSMRALSISGVKGLTT